MIGAPLVEMFTSRFPEAREDQIEHFVAEYRKVFLSNNLNLTRLLPGVVQVLSHYFPETRLAIATSRRSDGAIRILEKFGLRRYFPIIVGIEHVKDSKPHPEPIYRALEQLGTGPEDSVMVGDTRVDMIAGRRAELQTVGVTTGTSSETDLLDAGAFGTLEIGGPVFRPDVGAFLSLEIGEGDRAGFDVVLGRGAWPVDHDGFLPLGPLVESGCM